jgi:energy-coupling factor transporter ATP-binding protein EcfA2
VPEDALITANVSGGAVGIAGAQEAHVGSQTFINNFYGPTPQTEIAKPTGPIAPCPYPGLACFGPQDAARFFGREQAIKALQLAVAKRSFTALVGASGSGKSSVVLAGLAPRLETQGGWRSTYFRIGTEPDKNPFAALARALSPLLENDDVVDRMTRAQKLANSLASGDISLVYVVGQCRAANPGQRILLIADQFEEVFTLVADEALRERFIDALIEAFPDPARGAAPEVCLVLTLRADFYNAALRYRPLADRLQDHVKNLGPMTREELREAILKPTEAVEVEFEPGLVATILDDVEKRPGSLPLLQFALREVWGRLKTPVITRADNDAIGGVEGALAKRAQAIFADATNNETDTASVALFRRLFTRLVTLGEGAEDTRRIVGREELGPDAWALAQKLAGEDNRLVVTGAPTAGQETAEVVHEALIRNWPTLVDWVNRDRAFQLWLRQLKPRVDEWRANPSDDGTLLRGGPLAVAEEWVARRGNELTDVEMVFVTSGVELRETEQQREREDLGQKEAGRVAIATERVAGAFVELRKQLMVSLAAGSLAMSALYLSGLLLTAYLSWSVYSYSFVFIYTVCGSASGFAVFLPIEWYYCNKQLMVNPRALAYSLSKYSSPAIIIIHKWLIIRYFAIGIYSFIISLVLNILALLIVVTLFAYLSGSDIINDDLTRTLTLTMVTATVVAIVYAVCLTILIDIQLYGQNTNRVSNGMIIGILAVLAQILVMYFFGTFHLTLIFANFITSLAIGWHIPANVAGSLIRAKYVLDQCSVEMFTNKTQDVSGRLYP